MIRQSSGDLAERLNAGILRAAAFDATLVERTAGVALAW
jgi:hypothetical protein